MGLFEQFPYTNFHELNLDWFLNKFKFLISEWELMGTKFDTLEGAVAALKEYVKSYFDSLDVQAEINNKLDAMAKDGSLGAALDAFLNAGIVVYTHNMKAKGDTSWIMLKIAKSAYKLNFHNCSGSDIDSPTTLSSNPLAYLSGHLEADIATNCNYGGNDYPGRLAGVDYAGTNFSRRLFAYNSADASIAVYDAGTTIDAIPETYDTVFAIDAVMILNGISRPFTDSNVYEPRNIFGWDDEYYYVFVCEGRGNEEKGLQLAEAQSIFLEYGIPNVVNFDGGGSVCLAVNVNNTAVKVNKFRDYVVPYPGLRKVGLTAVYTRR